MKKSKFLFFGPFEWNLDWSNFSAPPLGVHRLASYLRRYGHYADVIDPDLEKIASEEDFKKFVGKQRYDFIGISPTHVTLENDLGLAYLAKKYSPESVSAKATRVNTIIRFATLYRLAKEMNIKSYADRADREAPRIENMLNKF